MKRFLNNPLVWILAGGAVGVLLVALLLPLFRAPAGDPAKVAYLVAEAAETQVVAYNRESQYLSVDDLAEANPQIAERVLNRDLVTETNGSSARIEATLGERSATVTILSGVVTSVSCQYMQGFCPSPKSLNERAFYAINPGFPE